MLTPAERLRDLLTVALRVGEPFDAAWTRAVPGALDEFSGKTRVDWRAALEDTRDAWCRAYSGENPEKAERALIRAMDPERIYNPSGRWCETCGEPLPDQLRSNARFCSRACRRADDPIAA